MLAVIQYATQFKHVSIRLRAKSKKQKISLGFFFFQMWSQKNKST